MNKISKLKRLFEILTIHEYDVEKCNDLLAVICMTLMSRRNDKKLIKNMDPNATFIIRSICDWITENTKYNELFESFDCPIEIFSLILNQVFNLSNNIKFNKLFLLLIFKGIDDYNDMFENSF